MGNPGFEYKIFLAPSANQLTSQGTGCDIVPVGIGGTSRISLAVTGKSISYADSNCWSSTYGSYTGYIKYIRRIGSFDSEIGEDFKITCTQNFNEVELNDKYSISFFGGFRHVSTKVFYSQDRPKSEDR